MPPWPIWTILLIAAGTFILLNLLRSRDEIRRQRPPMRGGSPSDTDESQSRKQAPVTDLDRFLQEVHRRRSTEGAEIAAEPPARRSIPERVSTRSATPDPAARAALPPSRRSPRSGDRIPSRRSGTSEAQVEAIPLAIAVEEPTGRSRAQSGPEPSATVFPGSPPPLPSVKAVQSVAAVGSKGKQDKSFLALLSTRQSLRNAVILREIFDPPLCKRTSRPH
jgi:hypothetical protein